jgi:pSer/pThr/pTyr-binding forkhead associated (FHA) protein
MKIILAEERNGSAAEERSFDKASVLIGRDAFECDIAFDRDRYPMVSRRHAELRLADGKWVLADLNSSYGTYLNGQQVSAPVQVAAGSLIQIGPSGPVLRVVRFAAGAEPARQQTTPPRPVEHAVRPSQQIRYSGPQHLPRTRPFVRDRF